MKPHQAQTTNVIAKLAMVPKHLSKGGHEESCRGENQQSIYFFCVLWAGAALQLQEGDGGKSGGTESLQATLSASCHTSRQ